MSLNNSIARLRRAGNEQGRTAQKIIDAANEVAAHILATSAAKNKALPQGYRTLTVTEEDGRLGERLVLYQSGSSYIFNQKFVRATYSEVWLGQTTLEGAQQLAGDVAHGIFDELLSNKEPSDAEEDEEACQGN